MRILVTRPRANGEKTAERLARLGHEPVVLPLFDALHDPAAVISALHSPTCALIFTSGEAVRAVANASPLSADILSLPVLAVGQRTAEAATRVGFASVATADGDGASLAALIAFRDDGPLPYLYLAGEPRSTRLENDMAASGISFTTVVCYRMKPLDLTNEDMAVAFSGGIDAVLLYSQETAARFFELTSTGFSEQLQGTRFLCLSPTIARSVPRQYAECISTAKAPSEKELFQLL
jgi:uroporphyrinogen-III synthase